MSQITVIFMNKKSLIRNKLSFARNVHTSLTLKNRLQIILYLIYKKSGDTTT